MSITGQMYRFASRRWERALVLLAAAVLVPTLANAAVPRTELLADTVDVMPVTYAQPNEAPATLATAPPARHDAAVPVAPPVASHVALASLGRARPVPPAPPPSAPRPVPLEAVLPPPPPQPSDYLVPDRSRGPGHR